MYIVILFLYLIFFDLSIDKFFFLLYNSKYRNEVRKMTVVKVLIGVAGVGKSTYIQKVKTEKSLVLSSDKLRIELFGDLEAGNAPEAIPVVFKTLHERMKEALLSKQYDTIFYDATNLSRKLRKGFYQ